MPKVTATCPCGKEFAYYASAQSGRACSNACSARYFPRKPRRGTETACETCQQPVYATVAERARGQGRFCSPACAHAGQTKEPVIKRCPTCNKEMRLKPSQSERIYCSKRCDAERRIKRPDDRLHNGRPTRHDRQGYVLVWEPGHPNKIFHGWQYEHRIVIERRLGRYLRSDEHVHHLNGVKDDNRDENLEMMDGKDHARVSARAYREDVQAKLGRLAELEEKLAEYERRFGPLEEE